MVAPDMAGDRMQVHHPHGDMAVHGLPSVMTLTGHNPHLNRDLRFAHDHTPHDHAHQRHGEVLQRQTPGTAGAGVPATAATAAGAAVPNETTAAVIK